MTHAALAMSAMAQADRGHATAAAHPPYGAQNVVHAMFAGASAQNACADAPGSATAIATATRIAGSGDSAGGALCVFRLSVQQGSVTARPNGSAPPNSVAYLRAP